jgi:hypothetical protein
MDRSGICQERGSWRGFAQRVFSSLAQQLIDLPVNHLA